MSAQEEQIIEVPENAENADLSADLSNSKMLEEVHELGKKIAKIVDDTIEEIETARAQKTDIVYINTDKNPPEVRRVNGPNLSAELWERIKEARETGDSHEDDVTICTIANGRCTVSLAQK
tara:strand:- start:181 stop:543 length:363 start_codon:yes stop_codon:yes gene_type:complete